MSKNNDSRTTRMVVERTFLGTGNEFDCEILGVLDEKRCFLDSWDENGGPRVDF